MKCPNCQSTCTSKFCNSSCAASYNNRIKPKRQPLHHCKYCGKSINALKRYCSDECKTLYREKSALERSFTNMTNSHKVVSWRQRQKAKAVKHKGGKCHICSYAKSMRALKFHHLDPSKKEFSIGVKGNTRSWERVKIELEKCILVCGNCHDEIHEGQHPQYLIVKEQ
jgi:predicted nucleic acid-binding Zn ribbon protein